MNVTNKQVRQRKFRRRLAGAAVISAILLVAVAIGSGLFLQAGVSLITAGVLGTLTFVVLIGFHKLMKRAFSARALRDEVARLNAHIETLSKAGQSNASPGQSASSNVNSGSSIVSGASNPQSGKGSGPLAYGGLGRQENPAQFDGTTLPPPPTRGTVVARDHNHSAEVSVTQPAFVPPQASRQFDQPAPPAPAPAPFEVGNYTSFPELPIVDRELRTQTASTVLAPSGDGTTAIDYSQSKVSDQFASSSIAASPAALQERVNQPAVPVDDNKVPPEASGVRTVDVKKVHGLIKRLAEQVNAVEALSGGSRRANANKKAANADAAVDDMLMDAASKRLASEKSENSPSLDSNDIVTSATVALNTAADAMRTFEPSLGDAPLAVSDRERPDPAVVLRVSEAISAGRMDIWLSPIHHLNDKASHHFEVTVSLRDETGATIDVSQLQAALRGTGLLSALDGARLVRAAQIGERLETRGRDDALFSDVSAEALEADQFLNAFADAYQARATFSGQLVIVFQQRDVRRFTAQSWATLQDMQQLGFRFALSGVTDLDMNFAELRAGGFAFVKLRSSVFSDGLQALGQQIPAKDVCQHLAQAGLTIVAEGIKSEQERAKLFGFGVLFGQGELFGGKRAVRSKTDGVTTTSPSTAHSSSSKDAAA